MDGDGAANEGNDTSAGTASINIVFINHSPTGAITIIGAATEDQVLSASSTLADADGLGTLHYQWQRDSGIGFVNVGTDVSTYRLGEADGGGQIRVVVSYIDGYGRLESVASAATARVVNVNDAPQVTTVGSYNVVKDTPVSPADDNRVLLINDPDNDPLTARLIGGPSHGALDLQPNGSTRLCYRLGVAVASLVGALLQAEILMALVQTRIPNTTPIAASPAMLNALNLNIGASPG